MEGLEEEQVFGKGSLPYKVAAEQGLAESRYYVFTMFPDIVFFYSRARDALVIETRTQKDLLPGGVVYEYFQRTLGLKGGQEYALRQVDRYYTFNERRNRLEETSPEFGAHGGTSEEPSAPPAFSGAGHRLGSSAVVANRLVPAEVAAAPVPASASASASAAAPAIVADAPASASMEDEDGQRALLNSLQEVSSLVWRSESEGLSPQSSADPTSAGHFLESGALLRSLSNQPSEDDK
jgi:hypothetical protein